MLKTAWRDFSTGVLMTLTLPDGVLHLGRPLPQDPGKPLLPPALETINDPELAAVHTRYNALEVKIKERWLGPLQDKIRELLGPFGAGAVEVADVGTPDWTILDERMRYILTLFRMRQQDPDLFVQPFTEAQRASMFDGQLPIGPL